jgi:ADP-heptose:LPS heptosyltransferase
VVWTFGPDDLNTKNQLQILYTKEDLIYLPPTLLDLCHLIKDSELLISTSTGPMHLAGALNIKTISFFGDSLFASPEEKIFYKGRYFFLKGCCVSAIKS